MPQLGSTHFSTEDTSSEVEGYAQCHDDDHVDGKPHAVELQCWVQCTNDSIYDDDGECNEGKAGTGYTVRVPALVDPQDGQPGHDVHEGGVCRDNSNQVDNNKTNNM